MWLRVTDDGDGFDLSAPRSSQSFGLTSMRERAESLGGRFEISSTPGAGTTIEVVVRVSRPVRVLIADDHAPTRAGVRMALEHEGCEVCAEAASAAEAVRAALAERPDICLVDLGMPGNGFRAVSEIASQLPDTPVLVLTVSRSQDDLFDALRAGAAGYLLKDMDPEDLVAAVRRRARRRGGPSGVPRRQPHRRVPAPRARARPSPSRTTGGLRSRRVSGTCSSCSATGCRRPRSPAV